MMLTTEKLAEAISASGIQRGAKSGKATITMKAATDTIVTPQPGTTQYDPDVVIPRHRFAVRELIPEYPVSAGHVGFYTLTPEGAAGVVAEDGAKPQLSAEATLTTLPLVTVAGLFKAADEILDDYARLTAAIQQEGRDQKDLVVEDQLVNGTGASGQMTGLLTSISSTITSGALADILAGLTDLEATGYQPDGIVMAPSTFRGLITPTASDAISYLTNIDARPTMFGVPVVLTTAIAAGSVILGDFRRGARLYTRGTRADIGYDADDFSHDRVTIRVAERLALAVKEPAAFKKYVA